MTLCTTEHRILTRWEPRRWLRWKYQMVIFCACCDLKVVLNAP